MHLENGIWTWNNISIGPKPITGYEDILPELNIYTVDEFKALDKKEQKKLAVQVLKKIREVNIFPVYYYSEEAIRKDIIDCCVHVPNLLKSGCIVEHGRAGNTLLDYMFPNLHRVDAGTAINNSMYNRFYDDKKLLKCVTRHMQHYQFTNMRTMFFMYGRYFWNTATGFSPMRAKAIYSSYCLPNSVVYDFSAGFGGRMLGALSSPKANYHYIGCEPSINTFYNLNRLGQHIESVTGKKNSYELYNTCSESLELDNTSVDFAFSCPPYFDLERYCDEETQCYIKYKEYETWLDKYATGTLSNVHKSLRVGGMMGIVIGKVLRQGVWYDLPEDFKRRAAEVGFRFVDKIELGSKSRKPKENREALYLFRKV